MGIAPDDSQKKGKGEKGSSQRRGGSQRRRRGSQRERGRSQQEEGSSQRSKTSTSKSKHRKVKLMPMKRVRTTSLGKRVYTDSSGGLTGTQDPTEESSAGQRLQGKETGAKSRDEGERFEPAASRHIAAEELVGLSKRQEGGTGVTFAKLSTLTRLPAIEQERDAVSDTGKGALDRFAPSAIPNSRSSAGNKRSAKLAVLDVPMSTSERQPVTKRSKQVQKQILECPSERDGEGRKRQSAISPGALERMLCGPADVDNLEHDEVESDDEDDIDAVQLGGPPIVLESSQLDKEAGKAQNRTVARREPRRGRKERKSERRANRYEHGGEGILQPSKSKKDGPAGPNAARHLDRRVGGSRTGEASRRSEKGVKNSNSSGIIPSSTSSPTNPSDPARRKNLVSATPSASSSTRRTLVEPSTSATGKTRQTGDLSATDKSSSTGEPLFGALPRTLEGTHNERPSIGPGSGLVGSSGNGGGSASNSGPSGSGTRTSTTSNDRSDIVAGDSGGGPPQSPETQGVTPIRGSGNFVWNHIDKASTLIRYPELSTQQNAQLARAERYLLEDEAISAYRNVQRLIIIIVTRLRNGAAESHEPLKFLEGSYWNKAWVDLHRPLAGVAQVLERPSWNADVKRIYRTHPILDDYDPISVRKNGASKNKDIERCNACDKHQEKYVNLHDMCFRGPYHGQTLAPKGDQDIVTPVLTLGNNCFASLDQVRKLWHLPVLTMRSLQNQEFSALDRMSPELRKEVCRDVVQVDEIIRILGERGIINEVVKKLYMSKAMVCRRCQRILGRHRRA